MSINYTHVNNPLAPLFCDSSNPCSYIAARFCHEINDLQCVESTTIGRGGNPAVEGAYFRTDATARFPLSDPPWPCASACSSRGSSTRDGSGSISTGSCRRRFCHTGMALRPRQNMRSRGSATATGRSARSAGRPSVVDTSSARLAGRRAFGKAQTTARVCRVAQGEVLQVERTGGGPILPCS